MYCIEDYKVQILVDLEPNVYMFQRLSATGKSRLCKCLKKLCSYGEPVNAYTYEDKLLGIPIESVLVPNKYKVILLDRYDMYIGDGKDLINECRKNSVILIDCKSEFYFADDDEMCSISMSADRIEVTLW